jgi:hypothetical protein
MSGRHLHLPQRHAGVGGGHDEAGPKHVWMHQPLDQSCNYLEDFDEAVARARSAPEVIGAMMEKYPTYGNPYTMFAAARSQFGTQ